MSISSVIGIALSGMQAQQSRTAATASNIANALTPRYDRLETQFSTTRSAGVSASVAEAGMPRLDDASKVDLASEMLSLVEAENSFKANAAVWETGADLWDVLMAIKRD